MIKKKDCSKALLNNRLFKGITKQLYCLVQLLSKCATVNKQERKSYLANIYDPCSHISQIFWGQSHGT